MASDNKARSMAAGSLAELGRASDILAGGGGPLRVGANRVRVPFRAISSQIGSSGASSTSTPIGTYPNPDGSGSLVRLTAAAEAPSASGTGASIETTFFGEEVGLAFARYSTAPAFDVVIDGVAYAVDAALKRHGVVGPTYEDHAAIAWFSDLGPGPHTLLVSLTTAGAGGSSKVLDLYGLILDRRDGYSEPNRPSVFVTPADTPTSQTAISSGSGTRNELIAIDKVLYRNTTGAAKTVVIKIGTAEIAELVLAATGSDGSFKEFNANGIPPRNGSSITHAASGAGVTFTTIGRVR